VELVLIIKGSDCVLEFLSELLGVLDFSLEGFKELLTLLLDI
jgi:hypothetical protein